MQHQTGSILARFRRRRRVRFSCQSSAHGCQNHFLFNISFGAQNRVRGTRIFLMPRESNPRSCARIPHSHSRFEWGNLPARICLTRHRVRESNRRRLLFIHGATYGPSQDKRFHFLIRDLSRALLKVSRSRASQVAIPPPQGRRDRMDMGVTAQNYTSKCTAKRLCHPSN